MTLNVLKLTLNFTCSHYFIKVVHGVQILRLLDGMEGNEVPEGRIMPQGLWMKGCRRVVLNKVRSTLEEWRERGKSRSTLEKQLALMDVMSICSTYKCELNGAIEVNICAFCTCTL